jgi:hypothetical protein
MPKIISIEPAKLLADNNNPRIPDEGLGQREALLTIAKELSAEILALAHDIVKYKSLDPSALPIVIRASQEGRYTVLEGNRRIIALRALENPSSFAGAFNPTQLKEMSRLSVQYHTAPIEKVTCCLMDNAEAAQHWIDLRHTGKNGGAGIVPWGPHEKARFVSRTRKEIEVHTRLLDFLQDGGHLTKAERQKVPSAAFKRLVGSKAVREKIGFSTDRQGALHFEDEKAAIGGLLHISHDLASGTIKTGNIYSKEQRVEYAKHIPVASPAIPAKASTTTTPLLTPGGSSKKTPLLRLGKDREKLIPADCRMRIIEPRIRKMAMELQGLTLEDYPNSAAVLFRVFLELSADYFLVETMKKSKSSLAPLKLSQKLLDVVSHLESTNVLSRQDAAPVRAACVKKSFLSTSVLTMNEYVHNYLMVPTPTDLRAAWDGFEPFIKAIWP